MVVKTEDIRRIEAFEMWIWRRMEKVSWVERKTNEDVLIMVDEKRELLNRITKTKRDGLDSLSVVMAC